ncbi:sigma-70 family RNA polymerase sigma factor [Fulvivirgaceae bacterium BMA12]|uniref:Sigma-70 family RNA polymerase sigma factor n=1 Tax=Agaribacillus aureus TaxID=3051825 RepID=A0ABT8L4V2_9BACT|nr:sigma-70 family RNA polymerase sigma factor [Fulvivirgaceae bacterium BMA12]
MAEDYKNKLLILYRDHYRTLFNYGLKIIKDKEVVRDCIQDGFYNLWTDPSKLENVVVIKSYLIGILRNLILKHIASNGKTDGLKDFNTFEISIEDTLIDNENKEATSQQLQRAISNLTPKQKEIIYLRFYEGLSYEEIEKITNTNYQSVRNLLSKAIKNLRKYILNFILFFQIFLIL